MKKTLKVIKEQSSKAILSSKQLNSVKGGDGELEFVYEYMRTTL